VVTGLSGNTSEVEEAEMRTVPPSNSDDTAVEVGVVGQNEHFSSAFFKTTSAERFLILKAVDEMASDHETVALSPVKRDGEAEATNPKKQKRRKIPGIAEMRMDSSELIQMRSKIAKSLTVVSDWICLCESAIDTALTTPSGRSS
jgi:hypothetical protein